MWNIETTILVFIDAFHEQPKHVKRRQILAHIQSEKQTCPWEQRTRLKGFRNSFLKRVGNESWLGRWMDQLPNAIQT